MHEANEAAHVSLLLQKRKKISILFRVSVATLNVFFFSLSRKKVEDTRRTGYVFSLSAAVLPFSTVVSVCSILNTVCHASYLGDLSVYFSLLFCPSCFSLVALQATFQRKERIGYEKRTMRR